MVWLKHCPKLLFVPGTAYNSQTDAAIRRIFHYGFTRLCVSLQLHFTTYTATIDKTHHSVQWCSLPEKQCLSLQSLYCWNGQWTVMSSDASYIFKNKHRFSSCVRTRLRVTVCNVLQYGCICKGETFFVTRHYDIVRYVLTHWYNNDPLQYFLLMQH